MSKEIGTKISDKIETVFIKEKNFYPDYHLHLNYFDHHLF